MLYYLIDLCGTFTASEGNMNLSSHYSQLILPCKKASSCPEVNEPSPPLDQTNVGQAGRDHTCPFTKK
jgi:hypothetical protein